MKFPVTFYAQIMESGELRVFISKMMFKLPIKLKLRLLYSVNSTQLTYFVKNPEYSESITVFKTSNENNYFPWHLESKYWSLLNIKQLLHPWLLNSLKRYTNIGMTYWYLFGLFRYLQHFRYLEYFRNLEYFRYLWYFRYLEYFRYLWYFRYLEYFRYL